MRLRFLSNQREGNSVSVRTEVVLWREFESRGLDIKARLIKASVAQG